MNKKVIKILSFAKGQSIADKYGRNFTVSNGTLTLERETETPDNPEGVSFVMRGDDIPVNEFVSKIDNPIFKPNEAFMKRLDIQFTDHFKANYMTCLGADTSSSLIEYTLDKRGIQTFANNEQDVDMTPWKSYQE